MLNVIIFGCDNTGKTTLANKLVSNLQAHGIKSTYVKSLGPVPMTKQVEFMHRELNTEDYEVKIYDRFPIIEEEVCGNVLRGSNNFQAHPHYITSILNQITLFIHCDPGLDKIQEWGSREQMAGIKEHAKELNETYSAYTLMHNLSGRTIKYNYNKQGWKDIADILSLLALVKKEGE